MQTPPLPVSVIILCHFAAALASKCIAHSTLKVYLSVIRQLQIEKGLPDPKMQNMAKLSQVLRGVRATQAGKSTTVRLPITPQILERIKEAWERTGLNDNRVMLWAAMLLCFFGFFRSGEILSPAQGLFDASSHLTCADLAIDSVTDPQCLRVHLKQSKTDRFKEGTYVCVGRTGEILCPVAAVLAWLIRRGNSRGPLFRYSDGTPLTQARFVMEVRKALLLIGENPKDYGGHSFRAGAATAAAQQGVGDATIKLLGRWRSSAYQIYIKTPPASLASYSKTLLKK